MYHGSGVTYSSVKIVAYSWTSRVLSCGQWVREFGTETVCNVGLIHSRKQGR